MKDSLRLPADEMRRIGYRVIDAIVDRFEKIDEYPAVRVGKSDELRERLAGPVPEEGRDFEEILAQVERDVMPYSVTLAHPRFLAFISSPSNFVSAMADALVAGYNPFVGTWLGGSGPSALELVTVDWLREMCGLPAGGGGLFTSGGSVANFIAVAAARHSRARDGLLGCTVYLCDEAHYSNHRALRLAGFTEGQIRVVPSDERYAMDVSALTRMVREDSDTGRRPLLVVATAGTTNVGAVDDMAAIAEICRKHGMWLHVDGSYGAAAMMSPKARAHLSGIERADSLSIDPHKWMFQPFEIGCVLVRDTATLRDTFQTMPDYLKDVHALGETNFTDYGVQLTRGFRALKLWMSLQYFGARRFREAIEYGVALAEKAEEILGSRDGWEVVTPAKLGILSFRYVGGGVDEKGADRVNDGIVAALIEDGFAMVSSTVLGGRPALRICTINPETTEDDIVATVEKLEQIASGLAAGG